MEKEDKNDDNKNDDKNDDKKKDEKDDEEPETEEIKIDQMNPAQQLFYYARAGDTESIKQLAKLPNFNVDAQDDGSSRPGAYKSQNTALHFASQFGHLSVVTLLDSLQATVDKINKIGSTPLHCAASRGHVEVVKYLLKVKANIHAQNRIGNYPLHCSVYCGHLAATKLLIDAEDDPRTILQSPNFIGMSPAKYAASPEMKNLILEYFPKQSKHTETNNHDHHHNHHDHAHEKNQHDDNIEKNIKQNIN